MLSIIPGSILVGIDARSDGTEYHRFWHVLRATTNTCEIREMRSRIIKQVGAVQEVVPWQGNFASEALQRARIVEGVAIVSSNLAASPWDGRSRFQVSRIIVTD